MDGKPDRVTSRDGTEDETLLIGHVDGIGDVKISKSVYMSVIRRAIETGKPQGTIVNLGPIGKRKP